jgi:hypothetical protein
LRILKVAVTFGGMKASYIDLICQKLWGFTASLIPSNLAERTKSLHRHRVFLYYMLEFVYFDLGYKLTFVRFITGKVTEGI